MKVSEIAKLVSGEVIGSGEAEIDAAADIHRAGAREISFIENPAQFNGSAAGCLLVPNDFSGNWGCAAIRVKNPKLAFALIAEQLYPRKQREPGIHPTAIIGRNPTIADGVFIGAYACIGDDVCIEANAQILTGAKIGDGVKIGAETILHPNVFVESGCSVGSRVVLNSGVVIGADGFGYVRDDAGVYHKFPQIGTVIIEDDVEIGANTCVDRSALGETRIGAGTKIDNLVQVGHNVQIGRRCVIAAQTGISGSTVIEDDCVIGGQVGFGDHARVMSGAVIGSQAGVLPGKIVRPGVWWGTPIQPLEEYKRQNAHLKALARLRAEFSIIKKKLGM